MDCAMPFPVPSSRTIFSGSKSLQCVLCSQTFPWEGEAFTKRGDRTGGVKEAPKTCSAFGGTPCWEGAQVSTRGGVVVRGLSRL